MGCLMVDEPRDVAELLQRAGQGDQDALTDLFSRYRERLKRIGSESRQELEHLMDGRVFLELWVKVRSGWADTEEHLRSYGYE